MYYCGDAIYCYLPHPVHLDLILLGGVQVFVVTASESLDEGIRARVEKDAEEQEDLKVNFYFIDGSGIIVNRHQ